MVAWESARWIMDLSIQKWNSAIINGILTCENEKQVNVRISNTYAISWLNLITEIQKIK
jgi:6,7-dimethyl-8-ribityllumazine synthase